MAREAVTRKDDNELLGYVDQEAGHWIGQTIFGYTFFRTTSRESAVRHVRAEGLTTLMGVWQYYDKDDSEWYPCVLKEAYENRVVVIRTNEMGYEDPDHYKYVIIKNPNETNFIKAS